MRPIHKNLAASSLLLLAFGAYSTHLSTTNRQLEQEVQRLDTSASSRDESRPPRRKPTHQKTLNDLKNEYPSTISAKDLLTRITYSLQSNPQELWNINTFVLQQLTLAELMQLRREIQSLDGYGYAIEAIMTTISIVEGQLAKNDPEAYFTTLSRTALIDGFSRNTFVRWMKEDPQGAVAWYTAENPYSNTEVSGLHLSQSRAIIFESILERLAEIDLKTAVNLISKEKNQDVLSNLPSNLISALIEDSLSHTNNDLLRKFLNTPALDPKEADPFAITYSDFWNEFVRTTNFDKSINLFNSLHSPPDPGSTLAIIISSRQDLTFHEKADWLRENLTSLTSYQQGLQDLLGREFKTGQDTRSKLNPAALSWVEDLPEGELRNSLVTLIENTRTFINDFDIPELDNTAPNGEARENVNPTFIPEIEELTK